MTEWGKFKSYILYIIEHYDNFLTWSDDDKLKESVCKIEKEINRIKNVLTEV